MSIRNGGGSNRRMVGPNAYERGRMPTIGIIRPRMVAVQGLAVGPSRDALSHHARRALRAIRSLG